NGVSDPVGSAYCLFTPQQTGTYTGTFSFPAQVAAGAGYTGVNGTVTNEYVNDTFLGASTTFNFTVTQTPYPYFQEASLPVSYWTRPINENDQTWSAIASNWLGQRQYGATYDKFNPQGWAPNTAHVSMTFPLAWGGIVGDDQNAIVNGMSFYSGTQYNLKYTNPIIMYGNVYFSFPANPAISGEGIDCVSLRTGQLIWSRPDINSVSFGQMYDGETPNEHGVSGEYLWYTTTVTGTNIPITNPSAAELNLLHGTYGPSDVFNAQQIGASSAAGTFNSSSAWAAIDPMTGLNQFNETNVPSGTQAQGPQGEWLIYTLVRNAATGQYVGLTQWNNTKTPGIDIASGITAWGPGKTNQNMSAAYDWNVTLDQALYPTQSTVGTNPVINNYNPSILYVVPGDFILGQSSGLQTIPGTSAGVFGTPDPYVLWAINLNATRATIGHVLFQTAYPAPSGNKTIQVGPVDGQDNVFTIYYRETEQWSGFSALTGQPLWGPLAPQNPWNYYSGTTGLTNPMGMGYGVLYTAGYGGELYAINCTNGNIMFTYGESQTDPNNSTLTAETVYGHYPTQVAAIANNKVYMVEEEHSLNAPAYHGAQTRCVDAFTGKLLWQMYGICSWQSIAVADGYFTWLNYNDGMIYANGPGPSATTINPVTTGVALGQSVEITGTVIDQTPQAQLKGTPAVSDQDQAAQMEYLIQHSINQPSNITGVPVQLYATDSSGVTQQIASVTSTGTGGIFHYLWTPPATGEYVITANFAGTQSYGPSSAQTAVGVVAAAAPVVTASPTPTVPPTTAPTPTPTIAPTPSPVTSPTIAPSPPAGFPATEAYVIAAAVIVIIIVAVAAITLRKRK
ncbi:MAG TPA: hypothetical protein VMD05_06445, partial [Candidatus Nanoarchaeia archaeon]|nr:hypothetical protein [Candidatus Nanoarchaeia archaeon]